MTKSAERFRLAGAIKAADPAHRAVLRRNIATYRANVARGRARVSDWENARAQATAIKWEAIRHLDRYLEQFEANVQANGGRVHWAEDGEEACRIILDVARRHGVRKVVKAKSMTTEEVHLNAAFAAAGIQSIETDLGEFICQLRGEPPYHILTPAMHLSKADIARDFHEKLGVPLYDTAEELTQVARARLREEFLGADMGVTSANFAVAETGQIALTENEGNIRLCFSLPRVHVALVGIEKIVPRLEDLSILWPMLTTSGTGQAISTYSSLVCGPRAEDEADGPQELHVVLLDNGRTRLLADASARNALQCIRCGACLNSCPVYESVGGHAYGTTYQGPIGSVITPHLRGARDWSHLSYASSLCGACTAVCPVGVDLHHQLLRNRAATVAARLDPRPQRLAFVAFMWITRSERRFTWAGRIARLAVRLRIAGAFVRPWTGTRDLPAVPAESFRDWWRRSRRDQPGGSGRAVRGAP